MSRVFNQLFIGIAILITFGAVPSVFADSCSDPTRQQDVCREMKHLRSQVLVLGAQRDLMQINFDLLGKIGEEVQAGSRRALSRLTVTDESHSAGLIGVQAIALDLVEQAKEKNGDALATANRIQQQCNTCHNSAAPTSGHKWEDIFKNDWSVYYSKCNQSDRNPYRCKSMHAMFSYYSGFFTAYPLGIKNYELTGMLAHEIAQVAEQLQKNNLVHGVDDLMTKVSQDAKEIEVLAAEKNPETFDRAMALTQTCMQCHADRRIGSINAPLVFKSVLRK